MVSDASDAPVPENLVGLPHEVTSFVGRRRERVKVRAAMSEARLVTLIGFGGIGKTRLALSLAAEIRRAFADGAYFVSLGSLEDPDMLVQAVATAIGVNVRPKRSPHASLTDFLRSRQVLLVLDNCEHVIDAVAALANDLLHACPRLRILATSREPLRIAAETVHPVAPLTVPCHATESLAASESVTLFVDRARAVLPGFRLTESNREHVAEICRHLEGVPLAIELAAVWLRSMSPAQLARNLSDHWALLTRGSRAAPARQRTMAACIEWSFDLCSAAERDVWAGLSVFTGGFELDAARAVCADLAGDEDSDELDELDGSDGSDGPDELGEGFDGGFHDVLAGLVDKSIVSAKDVGGRMRFRLLPPILHRGQRHLAGLGRTTELRRRHRDWHVDLAVRASDDWLSPRQVEWIDRLRREEGNIQSAIGFCATAPAEAELGLLMGARLLEFGLAQGLFQAGRLWFERLLPIAEEPTRTRAMTRAMALRTACWWASVQGDIDAAAGYLREGTRLAERLGEPISTLYVQTAAFVALFSGELERAVTHFDDAIGRLRAAEDLGQVAQSLYLVALAHALRGDVDRALDCHEQCLAITVPAGETWMRAYSLWIGGFAHWRRADRVTAAGSFRQSLELSRGIDDPVVVGLCIEAIAWMTAETDPERAATLLGAAGHQWDRAETSTAALAGLFAHHEDCERILTGRLGPQAFAEARDSGSSLTTWDATCLALGEHSSAPVAAPTDDRAVLTRREGQIADLVAQGLNNRDIAKSLVISKRTAETHVENILTKLGFTSRHQITAWVHGHVNTVHGHMGTVHGHVGTLRAGRSAAST